MYAPNTHIKPDPTDSLDETAIHNIFVSVSKLRFGHIFAGCPAGQAKQCHDLQPLMLTTPRPLFTSSPRPQLALAAPGGHSGAFWVVATCSHFFSVQFQPNHLPLEWPKLEN